jgi:hypothetical protein
MKPTKLKITNIGKIASETIIIDKPLILFYGEIKQGKTTILNSVRWVCGGEFPDDIIRHGEKEGEIELHFDGGMIARSFYRAKDGKTKARAVTFIKNGRPVPSPVSEIKRFLNPFLLDQDFLRNKSELERKMYFTELFSVDTTALDTELFNVQRDAASLRAKIGGYGEIDLKPVETVDTSALKAELATVRQEYETAKTELERELQKMSNDHEAECEVVDERNAKIFAHNQEVDNIVSKKETIVQQIAQTESEIEAAQKRLEHLKSAQAMLLVPEKKNVLARPIFPDRSPIQRKLLDLKPDTTDLEAKIQNAAAQNVRAEQYAEAKKRAEAKAQDEEKLKALELRGRKIKAEKQTKLKSIGDTCGIAGLSFDAEGTFIYDGTTAGMISDSQIMRLSSELSALYPEGFGLELLDRGESLGRSIFEYTALAEKNKVAILATVVGSKPADTPANVGVWVIQDGKIIQ